MLLYANSDWLDVVVFTHQMPVISCLCYFLHVKLKENIEKFFTCFVEEGKATVRLKEPMVDICMSKVMFFSPLMIVTKIDTYDSLFENLQIPKI